MSHPQSAPETDLPRASAGLWYQVIIFSITRTLINTGFRMVYPFRTVIARELGVPVEWITLGITLRSSLGLFSPIFGPLADSRGRKTAMLLGLLLYAAGMLLVALWPSYASLFISLLLVGGSKIIFDPAMYAYLGDHVPYHRRGLAIGLAEFGWSGAFLLGIPVAGWLIGQGGWAAPFSWLTLTGFGLIGLLWRILPANERQTAARPSLVQGFRIVAAHRSAVAGLAISLLITTSNEVVNIIYGEWLESTFGLQVVALGAASAVIGIAELGGEGLVAGFVDRLGKRRAVGLGLGIYALMAVLLPALPGLLLPLRGESVDGALLGLFLFYLAFEFTLVSTIPLMTELVPEARATLIASNVAAFSLGRVLGSLVGPVLFTLGVGANVAASVVMNLVALAVLLLFVKERT